MKDSYKLMLIEEMCTQIENDECLIEKDSTDGAWWSDKKKDFMNLIQKMRRRGSEASDHLRNVQSLECLKRYPTEKKLFPQFNTTIPSTAPEGWLVNPGGLVLTPKRNKLTDGRLQKLLLMRYNKDFVDLCWLSWLFMTNETAYQNCTYEL